MTSRFLKLVGSLPPEEQQLWLPNQTDHDPDSFHAPYFLNLKTGYDILLNNHNWKVMEMYTVQDHPPSPNESPLLPPLESLYKTHVWNQELPQPGDSRPRRVTPPSQNAISKQMMNKWEPWEKSIQKSRNPRLLQQLTLNSQQIIRATSTQGPLGFLSHIPSWYKNWTIIRTVNVKVNPRARHVSTNLIQKITWSYKNLKNWPIVFLLLVL
jgi:hypothetical protein